MSVCLQTVDAGYSNQMPAFYKHSEKENRARGQIGKGDTLQAQRYGEIGLL